MIGICQKIGVIGIAEKVDKTQPRNILYFLIKGVHTAT